MNESIKIHSYQCPVCQTIYPDVEGSIAVAVCYCISYDSDFQATKIPLQSTRCNPIWITIEESHERINTGMD